MGASGCDGDEEADAGPVGDAGPTHAAGGGGAPFAIACAGPEDGDAVEAAPGDAAPFAAVALGAEEVRVVERPSRRTSTAASRPRWRLASA